MPAASNQAGKTVAVKAEKVSKSKGRAASEESEDQEEPETGTSQSMTQPNASQNDAKMVEGDDEEDEEDFAAGRGQKRSRTNAKGDAVNKNRKGRVSVQPPSSEDGDGDEAMEDPSQQSQGATQSVPKLEPLPRDTDGFVAGSIVRVKLFNFLTYEGPVEFFPSPHLNLILGPNGTGKSSVVCAIALGLGFPPNVLDRAEKISSFVKTGQREGWSEIELKGFPGKKNVVIKRAIVAKNNASTWYIDGKPALLKDVQAHVKRFDIQAENLCSFIPQDRVGQFARMTGKELLVQTQRAAGDRNLTDWHNQLIEFDADLAKQAKECEMDATKLKRLENQNKELEKDVARWRERQELEREVTLWEFGVTSLDYKQAKRKYDLLKVELKNVTEHVEELKNRNGPMVALKEELLGEKSRLHEERNRQGTVTQSKYRQLGQMHKRCEEKGAECDELDNKIQGVKRREKQRRERIEKLKEEVSRLEELAATPPQLEDKTAIDDDMKVARDAWDEHRNVTDSLNAEAQKQGDKIGRLRAEKDGYKTHLHELGNVAKQRWEALRRADEDTALVVAWLMKSENQAKFNLEITLPAFISLDLTDPALADQIEACINWGQFKTFVASTQEDYHLLLRLANDTEEILGRKGRINVWFRPRTASSARPMTPETLKQLGFDGYALDFVKAPEALKWFLEKEANMNTTAIARNGEKVDAQRAIAALESYGSASFIAGSWMYRVSKSRYGKKLAQTSTNPIRPARNLGFQTVDQNQTKDLEEKIAECDRRLAIEEEEIPRIHQRQLEAGVTTEELKKMVEAVKTRRDQRTKKEKDFLALKGKLTSARSKLQTEENSPSSEKEREDLTMKLAAAIEKRAEFTSHLASLAAEILRMQAVHTQLGLKYLQVDANFRALEKLSSTYNGALIRATEIQQQKKTEFEAIREVSQAKIDLVRQRLEEVGQQIRDAWTQLQAKSPNMTLEDAMGEVEIRKARLETVVVHDPDVVRQYEERAAQIVTMKSSLEGKKSREERLRKNIDRIHSKWYPALMDLVSTINEKFSASFHAIGCAGEVQLGKEEMHKDYSIDIFVKFRSGTDLQRLTQHRQSGGERSLTTIMYLMALTEHSRTPFSLVDEINQGMDARAERVVHNQLVKVTCQQESGQYFLVTPKLLRNLHYDERMKILLVCNGGGYTEETRANDLKALLRIKLAQKQQSVSQ